MGLLFLFPWCLISSSIRDSRPTKPNKQKLEGGEGITFCIISKKYNPSSSSSCLLLLGVASATAVHANVTHAKVSPRGETIVRWEDNGGLASLQKFKIMDFFFTNLLTKLFANFFFSLPKI